MSLLNPEQVRRAGVKVNDLSRQASTTGRAFILVDAQHDFVEGGALGVDGATTALQRVRDYLEEYATSYQLFVLTRDWHIDPGEHFADTPDFVDSWPRHCVAGSHGATFHESASEATQLFVAAHAALDRDLARAESDDTPQRRIEEVKKGAYTAAYSGFEGATEDGVELANLLRAEGIEAVDVAGIATDYCVRATCLDAVAHGFDTSVVLNLCAGVAENTSLQALAELSRAGITVVEGDSSACQPSGGAAEA